MKNIKLITALALGSLLAVSATNAQDKPKRERPDGPPPGEGRPGPRGEAPRERIAKLAEELGLSAEQKTKIQEFMKSQADKRQELRDATPEERREKAKELRDEFDQKMKEVLTAEQYTKWQKLRPTPGNRPGGPGGPDDERRRPGGEKPAEKK